MNPARHSRNQNGSTADATSCGVRVTIRLLTRLEVGPPTQNAGQRKILGSLQRISSLVVQIQSVDVWFQAKTKTSGYATNHGHEALPALRAWNPQPRGWLF